MTWCPICFSIHCPKGTQWDAVCAQDQAWLTSLAAQASAYHPEAEEGPEEPLGRPLAGEAPLAACPVQAPQGPYLAFQP